MDTSIQTSKTTATISKKLLMTAFISRKNSVLLEYMIVVSQAISSTKTYSSQKEGYRFKALQSVSPTVLIEKKAST